MKRKLKVKFVDFWPGFDPSSWSLYKILSEKYDLIEVDDPDYLFDGGMGFHHLKYNCLKIVKISENTVPDFNNFDYGDFTLMKFLMPFSSNSGAHAGAPATTKIALSPSNSFTFGAASA